MLDTSKYDELGKWPRLVVAGNPVTPEQAMEILIRTDSLDFSSNDGEFSRQCGSYVYQVECKGDSRHWSLTDAFEDAGGKVDWEKYEETKDRVQKELKLLDLYYLNNSRIVSCYVGGPHGWCNWDGTIGCSSYNIGKHPTISEVYGEWVEIAKAFPYLDLRCQLIADEGEGNAVVEYIVKDGEVTVGQPGPLPCAIEETDWEVTLPTILNGNGERGCTFDQFKKAVDYTRAQMKESS